MRILVPCIAALALGGCKSLDLQGLERTSFGAPTEDGRPGLPSPVFVMYEGDARENGIETVFYDRREEWTEVTVVFPDEDRVGFWGCLLEGPLEAIRWAVYGRVADVESFLLLHPDGSTVEAIHFAPAGGGTATHADDDQYGDLLPKHARATIPISWFDSATRPRIYLTTWNHMFRESPRNFDPDPWVEHREGEEYAVYPGSRKAVEARFVR